jgi:hypothetical protein
MKAAPEKQKPPESTAVRGFLAEGSEPSNLFRVEG